MLGVLAKEKMTSKQHLQAENYQFLSMKICLIISGKLVLWI